MESAQAEDSPMDGGSNHDVLPSHLRLGKVQQGRNQQAQYLSLKRKELHTSSLTLSLGKLPKQIIKQAVDINPEENMGVRREGGFCQE